MDEATSADPYAMIVAFYEAEFGPIEADIASFARRGVGGPLLVLGCGTGRVCNALAAARPVTGLDRSPAMIARAQPREGVRYVEGDMTAFELGTGAFAEVIVPNAAFNFLLTRREQAACLACVHRALGAGAPLTLDLPMPHFEHLATAHTPEKVAWEGTVGDRAARRTREVHRRPVSQRLDLVDRYSLDGALVATSVLPLRLVFPAEVEWMLEAGGFYVDTLHGDYSGRPVDERSPRLLVRAIRQ
jgi:SAM-dependent methyltransferase